MGLCVVEVVQLSFELLVFVPAPEPASDPEEGVEGGQADDGSAKIALLPLQEEDGVRAGEVVLELVVNVLHNIAFR